MIDVVKQIINFYLTNDKEPTLADLKIEDESLLSRRGSIFVTIFSKWNIRWSSWNIKEIEPNIVSELIKSTIGAIKDDSRFSPLTLNEAKDIKIRVDEITNRDILDNISKIKNLDPLKNGVIVISKDYSSLAIILPNISPLLIDGEDFIGVLEKKLNSKLSDKDIIYNIETNILTSY